MRNKNAEMKNIITMSYAELEADLLKRKNELFNLRFQLATGQLEKTSAIAACKRNIARVKTVLRARQPEEDARIAAEKAAKAAEATAEAERRS